MFENSADRVGRPLILKGQDKLPFSNETGPTSTPRGQGLFPIMAYIGRLCPKWIPFAGFRYING